MRRSELQYECIPFELGMHGTAQGSFVALTHTINEGTQLEYEWPPTRPINIHCSPGQFTDISKILHLIYERISLLSVSSLQTAALEVHLHP